MENNNSGADDCSGRNDLNGYYLGEPDDFDGTTPNPGVGYGTRYEDGESPNAEIATNINDGENWSNGDFVCPLNGIWTPEGDSVR